MHQHSQPSPGQSATSLVSPSPHGDTANAVEYVGQFNDSHSDDADSGVGEGRHSHIAALQHTMAAAFIRWHVTGCWVAAADYANARRDWEMALMESGGRG